MLFERKFPNIDDTIIKLCRHLKLRITSKAIMAELELHPNYPSLLAMSDVLNNFNIENKAFQISGEKLKEIPSPFIAHINDNRAEFCLVEKIENNLVFFSNRRMPLFDFEKVFTGNVLIIISTESAKEIAYQKNKLKETLELFRLPVSIIGLIVIMSLALLLNINGTSEFLWTAGLILIFKTLGLITTILLLIQSIDANNPLIQKLCQNGNNINCSTVLSSNAANVIEGLTWSEVGFFYFAGSWLSLLLNNSFSELQFLAVINICSLPYTFYSIYYQARVAKQWCLLCCSVQAILWFEFFPLALTLKKTFLFLDWRGIVLQIICFLIPILLWIFSKPFFLAYSQIQPLKEQIKKFKLNGDLFNRLLTEQVKYTNPAAQWSIVLGNPQADNIITMISNPYCNPCSIAHQSFEEWLESANNIQLRIIFAVNDNLEDKRRILANHLMALDLITDRMLMKKAIADWYKNRDYDDWSKKYPVENVSGIDAKIKMQQDWCALAEIKGTPTIFINGYILPRAIYQISDLKYML